MRFKHLNEENIRLSCKGCLNQALLLYKNHNYEDLEELLRVEWQKAQDSAILLQKMYSEVSTRNLQENLVIDDIYEES